MIDELRSLPLEMTSLPPTVTILSPLIDINLRLEKMRAALSRRRSSEKEITVKTAKGEEFRFGGISEKFTRKLYEWEEQKGIAPESSTIALLQNNNNLGNEADGDRRAAPADHEGATGGW